MLRKLSNSKFQWNRLQKKAIREEVLTLLIHTSLHHLQRGVSRADSGNIRALRDLGEAKAGERLCSQFNKHSLLGEVEGNGIEILNSDAAFKGKSRRERERDVGDMIARQGEGKQMTTKTLWWMARKHVQLTRDTGGIRYSQSHTRFCSLLYVPISGRNDYFNLQSPLVSCFCHGVENAVYLWLNFSSVILAKRSSAPGSIQYWLCRRSSHDFCLKSG